MNNYDWSVLTPCDLWVEYMDDADYDDTNIDPEMAVFYADCLYELYFFVMDWPDYEVYNCAHTETLLYLDKEGVDAYDFTELADCIEMCYSDCDSDCQAI